MTTIRFGLAGLGRLGYQHAQNVVYRIPGAELAAVCSLSEAELARAKQDFPSAAQDSRYSSMGALRVSLAPQKNLVQIFGQDGVQQECVGGIAERFQTAYLNELNEFVAWFHEDRQPGVTVRDGVLGPRWHLRLPKRSRKKGSSGFDPVSIRLDLARR
jgi:hypothetical protein